ncbi:MAG: LysE family translocator [Rhodobacteraceae bacterium]|nr:LysE family translocator [Paracoccaceae bacterium]
MSPEFFLVALVLAMIPGTGVLFAVSCGLSHGIRGAVWGAVAGALGVVPHIVAVGLGISAILHAGSTVFEIIRIAGAVYLVYLAIKTWQSARVSLPEADKTPVGAGQIITRGVLINLLNPKLTLFFLAFLPQFLTPDTPGFATDVAMMGGVLVAQTFCVFLAYGLGASWMRRRLLGNPGWLVRCNQGVAALFAGLGASILASSNR